ncbi:MAG: ribosome maturation factor RimP [Cellvibrionales bacterium]|nr:MAG: ribosome maturation factor RimP [Cellvibrionales bacterium]
MAVSRETLALLIDPIAEAMGLKLWGIEYFARGKTTLLRVYIDRDDGIGIGDCERLSRQLGSVLDVEDPILGEYTLEVSSPGLDRPLYSLTQYSEYVGETIDLKLRFPFEERRKFKGELKAVESGDIVLVVDDHEYLFPFDGIEKARVVPRF